MVDAVCNGACNRVALLVTHIERVSPDTLSFADFVNRETRLDGVAAGENLLAVGTDTARLTGLSAWPSHVNGKRVAVKGVVRGKPGQWRIESPSWTLIELADQIGQPVALEGNLCSSNERWWFRYRDQDLYLTNNTGYIKRFPLDDFWRRVRVTGELLQQARPLPAGSDDGLAPVFVVRGATVAYLEEVIPASQRFRAIDKSFYTVTDGVPNLLPEGRLGQLMGNETTTRLYVRRNSDVITQILRSRTSRTLDILAQRMNRKTLPRELRLIYAAMLARVNDIRGRSFLLGNLASQTKTTDVDLLFCLGDSALIAPELANLEAETQWAEEALIRSIKDSSPAHLDTPLRLTDNDNDRPTVADVTVYYTDIPSLLMRIGSAAGRAALVDYVVKGGLRSADAIEVLCNVGRLLPVEDLLKLEHATQFRPNYPVDVMSRRSILIQLLRHKHPAVAQRFVHDLQDGFIYTAFRKHSSPEIIAALRPLIPQMDGQSKVNAQMVLLGTRDPVPALIALLDDATWKDKNLVLFELARLRDPRGDAGLTNSAIGIARLFRCQHCADCRRTRPEDDPICPHAGIDRSAHPIAPRGPGPLWRRYRSAPFPADRRRTLD